MNATLAASGNDAHASPAGPVPPDLPRRVHLTQVRMLFSHVPVSVGVACGLAAVMCLLIRPAVPAAALWSWLVLKCLLGAPRLVQAVAYLRSPRREAAHWWPVLLMLLAADSLVWGAAVWWLTPFTRIDVAAVTVACVLGVASVGSFTLAVDRRAVACFLLPMMLPNMAWGLLRGDAYGAFAAASFTGFVIVLLLETRRSQRRIVELLKLRYTHEAAAREREAALAQAEQHSAAKSRFLAAMSHEMRTPLHGVLGLARLLRDDEARPAALHRLDLLQRSGDHLLALIDDVLDFSRIEAGQLRVDSAPFALHALIDDVVAVTAVQAARKGLTVACDFRLPRPCTAQGDAARLRQVLHNLLGNAVKFSESGRITLRVSAVPVAGMAADGAPAGGQGDVKGDVKGDVRADVKDDAQGDPGRAAEMGDVLFMVEDTGIGIPAEELPRIFEPFHQVDAALDRRHAGSGLGLAISRELCRVMGGELACDSRPGAGSVFRFTLPLWPRPAGSRARAAADAVAARGQTAGDSAQGPASPGAGEAAVAVSEPDRSTGHAAGPDLSAALPAESPAASPAASAHTPPAGGPPRRAGRVLLVEDNAVNALVAEATLAQLGVSELVTLSDGAQAVDWLAQQSAALVLMDCQMPVMDGLEATRRIRRAESAAGRPRVPVVALTAHALADERQRCLDAGMDEHLPKPFRVEALRALLDRYLPAHAGEPLAG